MFPGNVPLLLSLGLSFKADFHSLKSEQVDEKLTLCGK